MPFLPMTIRNLTSATIKIERYEIHDQCGSQGHVSSIASNVTSMFYKPKEPSFICKSTGKVTIDLSPFQSCKANIQPANLPREMLSIFFGIEERMYQVDIKHAGCRSHCPVVLNNEPERASEHITFYHHGHHHLIIAHQNSYQAWMEPLRDDTQLSALSIPGTHNSATCHYALPSVRCQVVPVREQLKRGIRFLDIRVQPEHPKNPAKDGLVLVHGAFSISLTGTKHFRSTVNDVLAFLRAYSTETVVMSVKREGTGSSTDAQLSRILRDHYANDTTRWFTAPRVPCLGEARGKIVLVRRFQLEESLKSEHDGAGWCIDAETWADNSPHSLCPSGDICIQDFYEVLEAQDIEKKIQFSIEHLKRAAERVCPVADRGSMQENLNAIQPFYINFLTASNFWKVDCWPEKIAAKLNPAIIEYLCMNHNEIDIAGEADFERKSKAGDGGTGIVVCDWVGQDGDWDIIKCIVGYNARYEKPKLG